MRSGKYARLIVGDLIAVGVGVAAAYVISLGLLYRRVIKEYEK